MWVDAPAARAMVRHKVRQLVEERAVHLGLPELSQPWIQFDERLAGIGQSGRASQSTAPADLQPRCEFAAPNGAQQLRCRVSVSAASAPVLATLFREPWTAGFSVRERAVAR
jgi:hypothetical protein